MKHTKYYFQTQYSENILNENGSHTLNYLNLCPWLAEWRNRKDKGNLVIYIFQRIIFPSAHKVPLGLENHNRGQKQFVSRHICFRQKIMIVQFRWWWKLEINTHHPKSWVVPYIAMKQLQPLAMSFPSDFLTCLGPEIIRAINISPSLNMGEKDVLIVSGWAFPATWMSSSKKLSSRIRWKI